MTRGFKWCWKWTWDDFEVSFFENWEPKGSAQKFGHNSHVYSSADVILWFDHRSYFQIPYEPRMESKVTKCCKKRVIWIEAQWIFMDFPCSGHRWEVTYNHPIGSIYHSYTGYILVVQSHVIPTTYFGNQSEQPIERQLQNWCLLYKYNIYMVPIQWTQFCFLSQFWGSAIYLAVDIRNPVGAGMVCLDDTAINRTKNYETLIEL